MTAKENLERIYRKTFIAFFMIFIIAIIICSVMAVISYFQIKIEPRSDAKFIIIPNEILTNRIHSSFKSEYIFNYTLLILFKNFLFIALLFSSICFSFFINQSDLINTDGKQNLFSQIVSRGLYIIIFLTLLYVMSFEFLVERIIQKIDSLKNNTIISINLLKKGNEAYYKKNYKEALIFYKNYKNFVEKDNELDTRIIEVNNNLKIDIFKANKKKADDIQKSKVIVDPSTIKNQYLLGNYFYEQKDYQSALYYYNHVVETGGSDKENAIKKIDEIKKILDYQKKVLPKDQVVDQYEMNKDIKDIYNLKVTASNYENEKEYQKAYFTYVDILNKNPNLVDVIEQKNQVLIKLKNIACEMSELNIAGLFPRKTNFIFMKSKNEIVTIGEIVKVEDKFYLYDIKIINLDDKYNINYFIQAPYGETKSLKTISLYTFSLDDRSEEYFPYIYKNSEKIKYDQTKIDLIIDIGTIYNFTYNYKNSLNTSIVKLLTLRNLSLEQGKKGSEIKNISLFTSGLNIQLISVAIFDKISKIFLFFALNLIIIGIAWRFRINIVGNAPVYYLIFMILIPVFFYYFINFIQMLITYFYSIMILFFNFSALLIICLILNIILIIASVIILASARS